VTCPNCNRNSKPVVTRKNQDGNLIKIMRCLVCFHSWSENLGKSEVIFVDFKNKIVLEKKAS